MNSDLHKIRWVAIKGTAVSSAEFYMYTLLQAFYIFLEYTWRLRLVEVLTIGGSPAHEPFVNVSLTLWRVAHVACEHATVQRTLAVADPGRQDVNEHEGPQRGRIAEETFRLIYLQTDLHVSK
jgi:hypothetical protein